MHEAHHTLAYHRLMSGLLAAAVLVLTVSGALAMSWLRSETSRYAHECAQLEVAITAQRRDNTNLQARVAHVTTPAYLEAHAPAGLRPTEPEQIVWLRRHDTLYEPTPDAASRYANASDAGETASPLSRTFDLALLGTTTTEAPASSP